MDVEATYLDAIGHALHEEMTRDPAVCLLGMYQNQHAGNVQLIRSLQQTFGEERVPTESPEEPGIVGAAVGASLLGMRPVVMLAGGKQMGAACDQLMTIAAQLYSRTSGELYAPITVRISCSGDSSDDHWVIDGALDWLAQSTGLHIVIPSTPYDAKGLLKAAIRDNNPVVFLEEPYLYHRLREPIPMEDYTLPLDLAETRHMGDTVTVLSYGAMLYHAVEVAEMLAANDGIYANVIDLRTLAPLDMEAIRESVTRTNRVIIMHETAHRGGLSAIIAAQIAEGMIDYLDGPVLRVADVAELSDGIRHLVWR
jgi:pyruvate/2-oxoglutarate/acetoin dehydrogenase E1 component